jgi:hypothetical protein
MDPLVRSQPANTISWTAIGMARSIQGEPRPGIDTEDAEHPVGAM